MIYHPNPNRGSPRRLPTDADLFTLPARYGGLGVLSHAECSPHARAAMAETADSLLTQVFEAVDPSASPLVERGQSGQPLRQAQRCRAAFEARREALIRSLPGPQAAMVIDNASAIARKWMEAIPYSAHLRLSPGEVSVGLHTRTLCPGQATHCRHCALPNTVGHDDVCTARIQRRVVRHERLKTIIAAHVSAIDETQVQTEPFLPSSQRRTDLRITGQGSYQGPLCELDLTIVAATSSINASVISSSSISSSSFMPSATALDTRFPASTAATTRLNTYLSSIEAQKRARYAGRTASPFFPLVFSIAGSLSPSSLPIFDHWRTVMPRFDSFCTQLSISLLRSRTSAFAF